MKRGDRGGAAHTSEAREQLDTRVKNEKQLQTFFMLPQLHLAKKEVANVWQYWVSHDNSRIGYLEQTISHSCVLDMRSMDGHKLLHFWQFATIGLGKKYRMNW